MFRTSNRLKGSRILLIAVLLLLPLAVLLAVHDLGIFELEGNALNDPAPGDDWDNVYNGTGSSLASVFVGTGGIEVPVGEGGSDVTYFTGGGSKDNNDVSQWKYTDGDVAPNKDDITDAYAATYTDPNGHTIIYFGADRFANNGDSQIGFWFFRSPIGLDPDGTFSGVHTVGDLLALSDFTQGGNISTIRVFEWVGTGGDSGGGTLDLVAEGVDCNTTPGGDAVCGTVNDGDTPSPWPYTPKFGTAGTFPFGSIYEGGLDLTALGIDLGCFSSFLAETRSSQSVSAQLKDFALGAFDVCELTVDKDGDTISKVGDDVDYTITITNSGAITLYKQSITDTLLGDLTANAGCGASLAPGESCTINVSRTVQAGDPDPLPNTVTAVYDSKADLTGDEVPNEDSHSVNLFQPSVQVEKTGDDLSKIGDGVTYGFTITNTSSADTPTLILDSMPDSVLGDLAATAAANGCGSLAPGGTCSFNVGYTVQSGDPDPLVNTVTVHYHPENFTNDIRANDSHSVNLVQPCLKIGKDGDDLSKVGDDVNYTITVENCSSSDTPDLSCSISDPLLGINKNVSLASGASDVTHVTRTTQAGDPDPIVNTATADCTVGILGNRLDGSASHTVNLFQPSISFDKTGDQASKVGDDVHYTITLDNTSSADTPNLTCTISDPLLGVSRNVNLASGASDTTSAARTTQAGDPDPIVNTATATCTVDGFGNQLTASDGHSVNLVQPGIMFDKTCGPAEVAVGDTITYSVTLTNSSSPDTPVLSCLIEDAVLGISKNVNLMPGQSDVSNASHVAQSSDPDVLTNTASAGCTVGILGNVLGAQDTCSVTIKKGCALSPGFWKGGSGVSKWDQCGIDPIAVTAGFCTTTVFPYLVPSLAGTSYLGVLNLSTGGDVTIQLAFKYIAARLNQATFGVPAATAVTLDQVDAYFAGTPVGSNPTGAAKTQGQTLFSALNNYFTTVGETFCPDPGTF